MVTGRIPCSLTFVLAVAAGAAMVSMAGVTYSIEGGTMTVNATSSLAGKGLVLLWDAVDKGTTFSKWANLTNFVDSVPAEGGTFTIDLDSLGITNGQPCRIASVTAICKRLDKLHMGEIDGHKAYVDTRIAANTVYGMRLGYYNTGCNTTGSNSPFILGCGSNVFIAMQNSTDKTAWRYKWYGINYSPTGVLSDSDINDIALTNGVVTVNGDVQEGVSVAHAGGKSDSNSIHLGHLGNHNDYSGRYAYGWWSYVVFYGSSGNVLLDYIPVRRVSDDVIGFYDSVGDSFVSPSGTAPFVAGTETGETLFVGASVVSGSVVANRSLEVSVVKSALSVIVPSGLGGERLMLIWDSADKGDDVSAWAHSAVIAEQVAAVGGTYTLRLSSLGVRSGDVCRVVAANCFRLLDKLQVTAIQSYATSGVQAKDVYGVRLGYCNTGCNADNPYFMGYGSTFYMGISGRDGTIFRYKWNGTNGTSTFTISDSEINDIAITNGVISVNGVKQSPTVSGAAGKTDTGHVYVGRTVSNDYASRCAYGWWAYVVLYGKDGEELLNYIPVKRVADDAVGFYDSVKKSFVPSYDSVPFTAGTVTNETPIVAVNSRSAAFTVATIPGIMVIVK